MATGVLASLAGGVVYAGAPQPSAAERRAQAAVDAVTALELKGRQAQKLLPLIEKASGIEIAAYEAESAMFAEMAEAFRAFAKEDAAGQGFTPDVERRTGQASHKAKEVREQQIKDLNALAKEALLVLTPAQREKLGPASKTKSGALADPDRLVTAKRELADLQKQLHPQLTPAAETLLNPVVGPLVAGIAQQPLPTTVQRAIEVRQSGTPEFPRADHEVREGELQKLRTEINNWNLINGLNLTAPQMDAILAACDAPLAGLTGRHRTPQRLAALEAKVSEVLNAGQRQVLSEYKPCLVPPRNLKDPVRVGQASDHSQVEQWLGRTRKAPAEQWPKAVDEALQKEAEHNGEFGRQALAERRTLLLQTLRKAAALSDVDFEVAKAALVEKIAPPDRVLVLKKEIEVLGAARGETGPVARFILNRDFLEQLRARRKQMAAADTAVANETAPR